MKRKILIEKSKKKIRPYLIEDDDIVVNYMGFTVTFEDNLEPLLVRLHNEGKGWGIVAIEAAEED